MIIMKNSIYIVLTFLCIIVGCSTANSKFTTKKNPIASQSDTVRIANEELEYEVIIIDIGFNSWLNSIALPRNYYTQTFLENKNQFYITEWNIRAAQPTVYNPNLYEQIINYDRSINYGYEVNYLIYNYMIFFQNTYKQNLFGIVPIR